MHLWSWVHGFASKSACVLPPLGWRLILTQYCPSVSTLSAFSRLASASARLAAFRGCTMIQPEGPMVMDPPSPLFCYKMDPRPNKLLCGFHPDRRPSVYLQASCGWGFVDRKRQIYTQDMCLFLLEGIARLSRAEVGWCGQLPAL